MTDSAQPLSLFERLDGIFGIAGLIDVLGDRLFDNDTANQHPEAKKLHDKKGGRLGFKWVLTAWLIEETGGPKVYPGKGMRGAHENMLVSKRDFDVVIYETAASLTYCGVPEQEHDEVMAIMESYRGMLVNS